jgi:hypothetical protein
MSPNKRSLTSSFLKVGKNVSELTIEWPIWKLLLSLSLLSITFYFFFFCYSFLSLSKKLTVISIYATSRLSGPLRRDESMVLLPHPVFPMTKIRFVSLICYRHLKPSPSTLTNDVNETSRFLTLSFKRSSLFIGYSSMLILGSIFNCFQNIFKYLYN